MSPRLEDIDVGTTLYCAAGMWSEHVVDMVDDVAVLRLHSMPARFLTLPLPEHLEQLALREGLH